MNYFLMKFYVVTLILLFLNDGSFQVLTLRLKSFPPEEVCKAVFYLRSGLGGEGRGARSQGGVGGGGERGGEGKMSWALKSWGSNGA